MSDFLVNSATSQRQVQCEFQQMTAYVVRTPDFRVRLRQAVTWEVMATESGHCVFSRFHRDYFGEGQKTIGKDHRIHKVERMRRTTCFADYTEC